MTNIMTSPSKTKYFKATMHDGFDEMSVLSYNTSLHGTLSKAKVLDKAVKVDQFLKKIDEFTKKPLLTLASRSIVTYSDKDLPRENVKNVVEKLHSFSSLADVNNMSIDELVNVTAYVEVADSQIVELNTKFGPRKKMEALIYDETIQGQTKLCLWNDFIEAIPESGTYKFKDLRIKSYHGKYLTTTATTVIEKADIVIKSRDIATKEKLLNVLLPAISINTFEKVHFCKKCFRKALPKGPFILCDFCGSKSLLVIKDTRFEIKASFLHDGEKISITIPHSIFLKFAELVNISIEDDENLQVQLLTCDNIELSFSRITGIASDINKVD